MKFNEVLTQLNAKFPGTDITGVNSKPDPYIKLDKSLILEAVLFIKNQLNFETIASIGGVDYPKLPALCVVYHLASYTHKMIVALKVFLPREESVSIPSLCGVFKAANWLERETYDMFGIHFQNHPDHRRILCPEDWVGFPLRKDYVTPDYYNGMPVPLLFEDDSSSTSSTEKVSL